MTMTKCGRPIVYIRPVLSSSKVLGLIARSLPQRCRVQFSGMMTHASCANNMNLCLQSILAHGSAAGTATPKHPLIQSVAYVVGDLTS